MARRLPIVFATAKKLPRLDMWTVTFHCWDCRGTHSYDGGRLSGPPSVGVRTSPCGERVEVRLRT
jgi:hypothetical protein